MAPDGHFRDIGPRLRRLIEARRGPGHAADVARSAGMSAAHLGRILSGRRAPSLEMLSRVLIAIPARPEDLFRVD